MRARAARLASLLLLTLLPAFPADPAAVLIFNEVLYDPREGEGEWVELYNAGPEVDLAGLHLTDRDGHGYALPPVRVPPGGYVVVRVGPGEDVTSGPVVVLHMGFAHPILNNQGDDLLLEGWGRPLDYVSYGSGDAVDPPPPGIAWEGSAPRVPRGQSLALHPNGRTDDGPADWRASAPTPGASNDPPPVAPVLLAEALPRAPRDDEFVTLANVGETAVDLGGWQLMDGEGTWTLPSVRLEPGGRLRVARNATSLEEDAGWTADVCLRGCPHLVATRGAFALGDTGDEVILRDPTWRTVDVLRYGEGLPGEGWEGANVPVPDRGRLLRRQLAGDGLADTDTAADWTWDRPFRLGTHQHPVAPPLPVELRPVLLPEDGDAVLRALLGGAREEVILAGFTFSHGGVASALRDAVLRGVAVRVGVEGTPPGGLAEGSRDLLCGLQRVGGTVLLMGGSGTPWRRYALHHAKYALVDGLWVLVTSENFSPHGFPPDGPGNRGWGVAARSPAMAADLRDLHFEDWNASRGDVAPLGGCPEGPADPGPASTTPPRLGPLLPARATLLRSPDNAAEALPELLASAREALDVALFYLRWEWETGPNPYVKALQDVARRGVPVRVLLDSQAYNLAGPDDNDEAVSRLNRWAREGNHPLEARLFAPEGERLKLHNKGFLVDRRAAFVSSVNWNGAAAYENREVGLYVQGTEAVVPFVEGFEADWHRADGALQAAIQGPARVRAGLPARYEAHVEGAWGAVRHTWDLHGDGALEAVGPSFTLPPLEPGRHLLRLRSEDAGGRWVETETWITVLPGPPEVPPSLVLPVTLSALLGTGGWAWLLWTRGRPAAHFQVRTRSEPTNKREGQDDSWPNASRSRRGRSRSTPTAPSTGGSTGRG